MSEMAKCRENGKDCSESDCLKLCNNHAWFACEYHNDSMNCVALVGDVDVEKVENERRGNKDHRRYIGYCYLNRKYIFVLF